MYTKINVKTEVKLNPSIALTIIIKLKLSILNILLVYLINVTCMCSMYVYEVCLNTTFACLFVFM